MKLSQLIIGCILNKLRFVNYLYRPVYEVKKSERFRSNFSVDIECVRTTVFLTVDFSSNLAELLYLMEIKSYFYMTSHII